MYEGTDKALFIHYVCFTKSTDVPRHCLFDAWRMVYSEEFKASLLYT